jgi:hypothetical protein
MEQALTFKQKAEEASKETQAGIKKLVEVEQLLNSMKTLPEGDILIESVHALAEMEREAVASIQSSMALQREMLLEHQISIKELYRRIDR